MNNEAHQMRRKCQETIEQNQMPQTYPKGISEYTPFGWNKEINNGSGGRGCIGSSGAMYGKSKDCESVPTT